MHAKKNVITHLADKRIKRLNIVIQLSIVIMVLIVVYDSYVFETPLYYMFFFLFGAICGRLFFFFYTVNVDENNLKLSLASSKGSIVLLLLLVLLRFYVGVRILDSFNVIQVTDALYLFFIGIYWSKWKVVLKQIDNLYYELLYKWQTQKE